MPEAETPSTLSHRLPRRMLPWNRNVGTGRRDSAGVEGSADSCTAPLWSLARWRAGIDLAHARASTYTDKKSSG